MRPACGPDRRAHGLGRALRAAAATALLTACAIAASAAATPPGEAHASQPCTAYDAEKVWRAYDTIYTGSVASTERLPDGSGAGADVRVHFEVARTLKGSPPQDRWHEDLPEMVDCHVGGACDKAVHLYLPGTEIFYLDDFNGMYSHVSGACGVRDALAGTSLGVPGMVFSYYRELYGFSPPLDNPCRNPDHILVVRGGGGGGGGGGATGRAACVLPSTSERLGWEPFDRERRGMQHTLPPPDYDLPITASSQLGHRDGQPFSLSLSRLPAVGETAVVSALYDGGGLGGPLPGAPYRATVALSPNLEFVGLDGAEERWPPYGDDGGMYEAYSFDILPARPGGTHSFSATVRAVETGYAHVSYYGEYHSALVEMYAGDRAGLLVDDYHRMASPLPDMSGLRGGGAGWHAAPQRTAK